MTILQHRKSLSAKALVLAIAVTVAGAGSAFAQPGGHDDHGNGHPGWGQDFGGAGHQFKKGDRMGYNDWHNAPAVDYRAHHLRAPPHGYEWREVNGQYVLAAVATGLIASIILASH